MQKPVSTMAELSAANPEMAHALRQMTQQMLIVFVKRAGGSVTIPVAEVDDTGGDVLTMEVVGRDFVFSVGKKQ